MYFKYFLIKIIKLHTKIYPIIIAIKRAIIIDISDILLLFISKDSLFSLAYLFSTILCAFFSFDKFKFNIFSSFFSDFSFFLFSSSFLSFFIGSSLISVFFVSQSYLKELFFYLHLIEFY